MVTILGHRGYLGAIVERRWRELGDSDHVVNCIFPDNIALCRRLGAGTILVSSDAIADGSQYGDAKRDIEAIAGAVVVRSGIVDVRKRHVVAYDNWYCNPLTPLEWADLAYEKRDQPGVHVAGREVLSRWEVAAAVRSVFGGEPARPTLHEMTLDRTQPRDRERPPLRDALLQFREWLAQGAERERMAAGHA
jgi:hypothetical protein